MYRPSFSVNSRRRTGRLVAGALAAAAAFTLVACGSAPSAETAATREYTNEFGTVELPESIERVVSVDFYTPAALIDIGVTPVGVVNTYFTDTEGLAIPEQYSAAIAESDAVSIGEYYELNLEAIAQAKPDLVVATSDFLTMEDPLRAEIEKIAPIVTFTARDGESWRTRATELATILDREAELQPHVEAYNERRDEVATKYATLLDEEAVTVFVPVLDEWGTYADTHFATPILKDLGATFRTQQDDEINDAQFPNWFSYENLDRLSNADVIFVAGTDTEAREALTDNTIWNGLPAVQNDLVFPYIPLSPTGSFGWALDNLNDLDPLLAHVQAKLDAAQS